MKYLEQGKSVALFVLIMLSLALTFAIWTFTPKYEELQNQTQEQALLGDKHTTEEVVRPVKVLYHQEDEVNGTFSQDEIQETINKIRRWQISDVRLFEEEANATVMEQYLYAPGRAVLYYPGAVPFPVFDSIMNIADNNLPESTFNRVVVEWATENNTSPVIYFINTGSGRIYEAQVSDDSLKQFHNNLDDELADYERFVTDSDVGEFPIYVPESPVEKVNFNYLLGKISGQTVANAIMDNPSPGFTNDLSGQEYTDVSGAIMRESTTHKSINYVQPKAETSDPAIPSDLIFSTIEYINEHGGWTQDFLYAGMTSINQQINYQLYFEDAPVFSSLIATGLDVEWGTEERTEQVFRYNRPTYLLDSVTETQTVELLSGPEAFEKLKTVETDVSEVEDLTVGYELAPLENEQSGSGQNEIITFQASWYYKLNGSWIRLANDSEGGVAIGLE